MSSESLKPQFFVTRQNGNMVPLIAMDELPSTISIRNVARSLSPYDVSGMTGIGTFEARHLHHVVDSPSAGQLIDRSIIGKTSINHVDRSLMSSEFAVFENDPTHRYINAKPNSYHSPPKAFGISEQPPAPAPVPDSLLSPARNPQTPTRNPILAPNNATPRIDRNAQVGISSLPSWHDPSSLPLLQSAPGVKEYCSYWLRHGECDYAQQGCLYKHEMPLDKPTLEKLGLRDIPRWYREKHSLGSYLSAFGAPAELAVGERKRKEEIMGRANWRRGQNKGGSMTAMAGMAREIEKLNVATGSHGNCYATATSRPYLSNSEPSPNTNTSHGRQFKPHSTPGVFAKMSLLEKPRVLKVEVMTEQEKQMRKTLAEIERYDEHERARKEAVKKTIGRRDALETSNEVPRGRSTMEASTGISPINTISPDIGSGAITPPTSADTSESDEADAGHVRGMGLTHGLSTLPSKGTNSKIGSDSSVSRIRAANGGQSRSKPQHHRQHHHRHRVAPKSETGKSMMIGTDETKRDRKMAEEVDLLEGYDHSD